MCLPLERYLAREENGWMDVLLVVLLLAGNQVGLAYLY